MKICVTCKTLKAYTDFYLRESSKDGYRNDCKICRTAKSKAVYFRSLEKSRETNRLAYKAKKEKFPEMHKVYYASNKERIAKQNKESYQRHKETRIASAVRWAKENKGKANANKQAYKAAKIRACPTWVKSNLDYMWMMQEAYTLATLRKQVVGGEWHVDHIVPLRGETVSGLHVPWNLQVIPGSENMSKSNTFIGE